MEIAWRAGYNDFAMPYYIQTMKETTEKLDTLKKETESILKKA